MKTDNFSFFCLNAETALSGRPRGFIQNRYAAETRASVRRGEYGPAPAQRGPYPGDTSARGYARGLRSGSTRGLVQSGTLCDTGSTHGGRQKEKCLSTQKE